jgi:tRNA(Ile)-lysidine synthetase-like protein
VAPAAAVLERILADLQLGRTRRQSLAGGWTLLLRAKELVLVAPRGTATSSGRARQLCLPFPAAGSRTPETRALELAVPGSVTLEDGRRISAECTRVEPGRPVSRRGAEVELDGADLPARLLVRWPAPGDRFQALGAPGSKPLTRFLADRGIPREERPHVPVVTAGGEILWVVGIEPCERRRVRPQTERRLCLALDV